MQIFSVEVSWLALILLGFVVVGVSVLVFSQAKAEPMAQTTASPVMTPTLPPVPTPASSSAPYSLKNETYYGRNHRFQLTYPPKFSVRTADFTEENKVVEQLVLANLNVPSGGVGNVTLQVKDGVTALPTTVTGLLPQKMTIAGEPAVFFSKYFGYDDGGDPNLEMLYIFVLKEHTQYQFTFFGIKDIKNEVVQTIVKGLQFTK